MNASITPTQIKPAWFSVSIGQLIVLSALYFASVLNYPVLLKIFHLTSDGHLLFSLSPVLLLTSCFVIIFSLLAIPYFFKPILIFLLLSSALALYAISQYQVIFDYAMMANIFETHSSEAMSYLSVSSMGYFVLFGVLPAAFVYKLRITPSTSWLKGLMTRLGLMLVALVVIGFLALFFYKDYASVGRNNKYLNKMIVPAHVYYTVKYVNKKFLAAPLPYRQIGQDAKVQPSRNGKPTLMVLVVGETARAQNMQHNGYARNTNPYTQDLGIIALQQVSSCGTATAHSLPCMISNLTHANFKREQADAQDNVLDVIQHAGVKVTWIENDGGDKDVAKNINLIQIDTAKDESLCSGASCYDEVMVKQLAELLASEKKAGAAPTNKLIALHTIGSHGPTYYQRYPADKAAFTPACERSDIENCSDAEIVNVYDNTLVYTDYVLAQTIQLLQSYGDDYNVAMMYLSDHGESLGENGLYLHGTPYAFAPGQQTHVPWFIWLPDDYAKAKGIERDCIATLAKSGTFSHDNLFHSLLGAYGVQTQAKDPQLDLFSTCATAG